MTPGNFAPLPPSAAWGHRDARDGFEVTFFQTGAAGIRLQGQTAAVEDGEAWSVRYDIRLDGDWHTIRAEVSGWSVTGEHAVTLETGGPGHWRVNGSPRPDLDGCLDVDLESSAVTNTIPVHRMRLEVGDGSAAPAAYVRALDLTVERLEQDYLRADDDGPHLRYDYRAPAFDVECRLVSDASGLVLEYPGLASRAH